jgi:hypothetical protein
VQEEEEEYLVQWKVKWPDIFGLLGNVELCDWGKRRECLYGTIIVSAFCMGVKLGL